MAQQIAPDDFEKGEKITLQYTNTDGECVEKEKTVRMVLPEKNAVVFHHKREMVKFPVTDGDSGAVEGKLGNFKGFDPQLV